MDLDAVLRELDDHASGPSRALPAACYTHPAFFEAELEHVLRPGWHAVARVDELPEPGDYRALDLLGEPLVLQATRGASCVPTTAGATGSTDGSWRHRAWTR
jgi:hypothetical protein